MNITSRRILGLTFAGQAIFEPNTSASSITYAAAGGSKTTGVAVPAVQSMLADHNRALFINDVKNGEIAAQIGDMCAKYGRKFGVVDEFGVLGQDNPARIFINPFSALVKDYEGRSSDILFAIENITHTIIDEPKDDAKNKYWRDEPREFMDLGLRILLARTPRLATPGGLYSLLSDPETWNRMLEIEAREGDPTLKSLAQHTLDMRENNPEHYAQHVRAALTALKIFAPGSVLHEAGRHPDLTHEVLLKDKWVVCFVNPVRHADRLGAYFALHFLSLMEAQLSGLVGKADYILDEYCNAPLRTMLNRVTVFRAFGARAHFITQSRADSVRKYGEKETALLEENCTVKQYLKFSNFEEAERVSRAMGEGRNVSHSVNVASGKTEFSGNLQTGRERLFTADELMRLPSDEQILHVADIGWIHCKKIRQNNIAPYCYDLGDNPLEGGQLLPDPKVTLPVCEETVT